MAVDIFRYLHLKEGVCRSRKLNQKDGSVATSGLADGKSGGSMKKHDTHRVPAKRFPLRVTPPNSFIHYPLLKNFTSLLIFTERELVL